jgi:hypothetical protein
MFRSKSSVANPPKQIPAKDRPETPAPAQEQEQAEGFGRQPELVVAVA